MPRVLALILLVCCLSAPVVASELVFAPASKPAAVINFDGSRHLDICHGQKSQEQKQESATKSDDVSFEKSDEAPVLLLVGAGIAAAVAGVAVKWQSIAKTVTAVH